MIMSYTSTSNRPAASPFGETSFENDKTREEEAQEHDDDDDDDGTNSSDEALLDMLGLTSLDVVVDDEEDRNNDDSHQSAAITQASPSLRGPSSPLPTWTDQELSQRFDSHQLQIHYAKESVCIFPSDCSVPGEYIRRLTDELVWGGAQMQADKSYETVRVWKQGEIYPKKVLTRLEQFVDTHKGWSDLCHGYLQRLVSKALGVEMVLYKEKLNVKPAGGSGFAPHLDTPSLRIALGEDGPQTFCTVMVAIDDMTVSNGCLRICKGEWSEDHCISTIAPDADGNPDAGGRAGAIPLDTADSLKFEPLVCKGGTIVVFNGWAPHRSAANASPFPRRAVFLTYNPKEEGDFHKRYYENMEEKRQAWRESVGLASQRQCEEDERLELQALSTIPKIG
jgi:hypothetical protein